MLEQYNHFTSIIGLNYGHFLRTLHERLTPRTYLEIGVRTGATFKLADCAAIAIDPEFMLKGDVTGKKPLCLQFQETSDAFFAHRDPTALLGAPLDMAFLDGMHLFEFLLRDFINTERHAHRNAVIVLHDCLPAHIGMSRRERSAARSPFPYNGWWTGDVWKIVPVLRQYRPDLSVEILDCWPTGLVLVTNLDPTSTTLSDAYTDIVARHEAEGEDPALYERYWQGVEITQSRKLTPEQIASRYNLRR